jgi:DNA polymerase III subunit epsilon
MDFVAIDFETANANYASVCQVGAITFRGGEIADRFVSLVDPQDFFDPVNISKHGLTAEAVRGAPIFTAVQPELARLVQDRIVVCHMPFDRTVFHQVHAKHRLACASCRWLDTARVARRAWPQYASTGYGLKNLAEDFGIPFHHHDAGEDARAAGLILVRAIQETGIALEDWLKRIEQPIHPTEPRWEPRVSRDGDPDGALHGEVLVFTGALSMPRAEAADMAAAVGCEVDDHISKRITILVVGDQDVSLLAEGQTKSSKHRKVEELIAKGRPIRILCEADFVAMCRLALPEAFLHAALGAGDEG